MPHRTKNLPVQLLKEQLRLYAYDTTIETQPDLSDCFQTELTMRDRLAALLESNLDFRGQKTGYASHDLHAFAAKFPPQLARTFIRGLTRPGQVVLDPMVGSGTTLVEAAAEGRMAIGLDIDPLATRLAKVKTTALDPADLKGAGLQVLRRATLLLATPEVLNRQLAEGFDKRTKEFIDYWFYPSTQRELLALAIAISEITETSTRQFLELTFSSVIVTKSGGVSRARDLAHTRPHLDAAKVPKSGLEQFAVRLRKNAASIAELKTNGAASASVTGDARLMPLQSNAVNLIVTSPPYANAIDYVRAHKFSLVWLGESITELKELRAQYIGSERLNSASYAAFAGRPQQVLSELAKKDASKANILRKYFSEMRDVLSEMYRVLRPDSAAVVVVGTSVMRGMDVQTHSCLADMAEALGFEVVGLAERTLDRDKRMMPARFGDNHNTSIEQRMHKEYVLGLLKPPQYQR